MPLLTKEQIFESDDNEYVDVEVPEWGGTVRVQVMTGWARDKYETGLYQNRGKFDTIDNLRARFISFCAVDENGLLLFSQDDLLALGQKSAKALDRVFSAASELNSTGVEGLEEAAKNS